MTRRARRSRISIQPVSGESPQAGRLRAALLLSLLLMAPHNSGAQATSLAAGEERTTEEMVTYEADFFDRYQPNTALDMVARLPGFQIDNGGDKRGFGGAAGNILINDRYPSAKQDSPSAILDRIPAGQVRRIKLVRGQSSGIDLRGQAAVASVILLEDVPATTRYEVAVRKNLNHSPLTSRASLSFSDRWHNVEYNAGIDGRRFRSEELGPETVFDSSGEPVRVRFEDAFLRGVEGSANVNATTWIGETLLELNVEAAASDRREETNSVRTSGAAGAHNVFVEQSELREFEFGGGAERSLNADFLAKMILLYIGSENDAASTQRQLDVSENQTLFRLADTLTKTTEGILRFEFDWAGWADHAVQLNVEGARNVIDNALVQTTDAGDGSQIVPVPGANTRVEEDRADVLLSDTWFLGNLELDYGLGAEFSTISQTGEGAQERSFSFIKPHMALTYSPNQKRQTRFRIAREVSQLDFEDFVSSTVFQDDDLALGNPDLEPESTWIAELGEERRFGSLGVIKLSLFHHWISDVEDLLPLAPDFEAPGNIGDGRRWGVEFKGTVPFEYFGLAGARFDLEARLQDSTVKDPVTGSERVLTGEPEYGKPLRFDVDNRYVVAVNFRHDNEAARFAWGWDVRKRGDRARYKVNELEVHEDGTEVNVFFETTRWFNQKIRLTAENLLDFRQLRYRTLYSGARGLSPIEGRELRDRTDGRRVTLTISGSF